MAIYYIDYENVGNGGLEGLSRLTKKDSVFILYSQKVGSMKLDFVNQIMDTKAKIKFEEAYNGTPNALDFQLVAMLFAGIKKRVQYYIISKDTGFDAAVNKGAQMGYPLIKRRKSINDAIDDIEPVPDPPKRKKSPRIENSQYAGKVKQARQNAAKNKEAAQAKTAASKQTQQLKPVEKKVQQPKPEEKKVQQPKPAEKKQNVQKPAPKKQETPKPAEKKQIEADIIEEVQLPAVADLDSKLPVVVPRKSIRVNDVLSRKSNITLNEEYETLVLEALNHSNNKNQFYHYFAKKLGEEKGRELYISIRRQYDELKKLVD